MLEPAAKSTTTDGRQERDRQIDEALERLVRIYIEEARRGEIEKRGADERQA